MRTTQGKSVTLALLLSSGLLVACAHPPEFQAAEKYKDVKVLFDKSGCPVKVTPDKPLVLSRTRLEGVQWEAVGPGSSDISVFFDPFQQATPAQFQARGKVVRSGPIAPKAPASANGVEYKYTIVAKDCPQAPLDPLIIVKN
ncbi:hypothetical protein [Parahaliea aestuarii]|uniref:Lipoprotein n=1 Tax=Parahaliea aestuarii TaxID=1852021 RepID=A0A5C8ZUV0_9GAMM|nr:hypothetical protein [Parahaliea aestuarii]TXS91534.1 hypothetical protein FVW59_10200 [Parahaliea aestuarii]